MRDAMDDPDEMAADTPKDQIWQRVDARLQQRRKSWAWLGEQLGLTSGRMGNWNRRGIPASLHVQIAAALDESVDWLLGLAPPRGADPYALSPMALRIAMDFDSIKDDRKQLDLFATIISLIGRAHGT